MKEFDWKRLGNLESGRKNLGDMMPVSVYRLMQYTISDCLEEEVGKDTAYKIIRKSGLLAGIAFAKNILDLSLDFTGFVNNLQQALRDFKIGVLKIEKADIESLHFILTVSEDLDCSGLPIIGEAVCIYDEGFIAGILFAYTNVEFEVTEIDCWATGDRTCRFEAKPKNVK